MIFTYYHSSSTLSTSIIAKIYIKNDLWIKFDIKRNPNLLPTDNNSRPLPRQYFIFLNNWAPLAFLLYSYLIYFYLFCFNVHSINQSNFDPCLSPWTRMAGVTPLWQQFFPNSHSLPRPIHGILFLQTNTLALVLHLRLPCRLWSSPFPLALHFKIQRFSQNMSIIPPQHLPVPSHSIRLCPLNHSFLQSQHIH